MLSTLAIANYRSLRDVRFRLGRLNVLTGANGSGKSSLYRSLRLLSQTAQGTATRSIAGDGGFSSLLWAGPESIGRRVRSGDHPVQGGPRKEPVHLRLGFAAEPFSYAIDFGLPTPVPRTLFGHDPEIKREVIWHGELYHERSAMVDRRAGLVRARDDDGRWQVVEQNLPTFDSMLTYLGDPARTPEAFQLRREILSWRFYDHFRSDREAPARRPQIGTRTPVLADDGHDLAAAWQTIREVGDGEALDEAVADAFPGAIVEVQVENDQFSLHVAQPGLLRPLSQAELSDGTLRYLLWVAALLTPRPPTLMVLNEPETSLHPDLLRPLARLIALAADHSQVWVVSHAKTLVDALGANPDAVRFELDKEIGETFIHGLDLFDLPPWTWPKR